MKNYDLIKQLSSESYEFVEKILHVCGPVQFKPVFFRVNCSLLLVHSFSSESCFVGAVLKSHLFCGICLYALECENILR